MCLILAIFLVEVDNNNIPFSDMGYHLVRACEYQNWYNGEKNHSVYMIKDFNLENINKIQDMIPDFNLENINEIQDMIPVGSLEFVEKISEKLVRQNEDKKENKKKKYNIKPINIPSSLQTPEFLQRKYIIIKEDSVEKFIKQIKDAFPEKTNFFLKSNEKCKDSVVGIFNEKEIEGMKEEIEEKEIIVSEVVDITAEWRVFVFRDQIQDAKIYSGEIDAFPDLGFIKKAVKNYKDYPPAYTLDVAKLNNGKMAVIEVHNFISCGLYGFEDYRILPQMIISAYKYQNR